MGCSKNLVDSERLIRRLEAKGYSVEPDPDVPDGEYVVINTCGFIGDAKKESIDMILDMAERKNAGSVGNIFVMGCLSERYLDELKAEIPEVDRWYGKFNWNSIIDTLPDAGAKMPDNQPQPWERTLTTPPWSAFIKISEGCNRFCAFCAIPLITGRHTSRPVEEILAETSRLAEEGVREFNVIAQDLSSYGTDLYGRSALAELIDRMADIEGVEWIRLHYAYPADFPMDILDVMARRDNVCKYLDIALQHIADPVLSNMHRHITGEETRRLLETIRARVPGIHIRTTLMTGFPGEGEKEFEELLEFVRSQKFERMGAFAYCEEEGTSGARLYKDDIPQEVKQQRLDTLMALQQEIADSHNDSMVGKRLRILIDDVEGDYDFEDYDLPAEERLPVSVYGRTEFDSPDVDQEVFIEKSTARPGEFVEVEITDTLPFQLIGVQTSDPS